MLDGNGRKSFAAAYQEGRNFDLNEVFELAESLSSGEQFNEIIVEIHRFERITIEEEIEN